MAYVGTRINVGKLSVRRPMYPSESGYVSQMRSQMLELQHILNDLFDAMEYASPDIMLAALGPTFEISKVLCPKDTGALVESGYLETTSTAKGATRVEIGYARGGNPSYAIYVHEMTEYNHAPPTMAKWLQAAVMGDLDNIFKRLRDGYQSSMMTSQMNT